MSETANADYTPELEDAPPESHGGAVALVFSLLIASSVVVGFIAAESWILGVAALALVLTVGLFLLVPVGVPTKLSLILIAITFIQKSYGYIKATDFRGLNAGNLLLATAFLYWVYNGVKTRRWYRRNPADLWLLLSVIVVPLFSIVWTIAYRKAPGYMLGEALSWYKQWVTPFVYYFLLSQCLDRRKDVVVLLGLVLGLVAAAVIHAMPQALQFTSWHEERSEGFVQEANSYAALLASTSPFIFLVLFMKRDRPVLRLLSLCLLGGMAVTLLTTYSRSGYLGFGLAIAGSLYVAYRATGRIPVGIPAIVVSGLLLLPLALVPQLVDYIQERFEMKTYQRWKRKSYGKYSALNQYSGDRLEIWKGGVEMSRTSPVVGVGFHTFQTELPKYHSEGTANFPHNHFLGTLAEGGVIWFSCFVIFFWKLLRFLYQNWRVCLAEQDAWGSVVCGGAVVCFVVMLWISLTLDFHNPGPKTTVFWVIMAGAGRYASLPSERGRRAGRSLAPAGLG